MTGLAPVFGLLAGTVSVADTVPYIRDILRGTTRPHRGTWLIWAVLALVACASQHADGASWSLVMAATQAVLTTAIFLLAIGSGEGGMTRVDLVMLGVAASGVAGWLATDDPLVATACVVGADLVGAAMMVPKTYRDPHSETLSTFALASLAGAFAALAVGSTDLALLLYPVYFCVVNGALALLIRWRRGGRPPRYTDAVATSSGTVVPADSGLLSDRVAASISA
jgi:hypothetical protein